MSQLFRSMMNLHDLLNKICAVESDVLDTSLKGLFRKKDFLGNAEKLSTYTQSLQTICQEFKNSESNDRDIEQLISIATDYCEALLSSTMVLGKLNNALGCKARGLPYSLTDYNKDLNLFQNLQAHYLSFGDALNDAYQKCQRKL